MLKNIAVALYGIGILTTLFFMAASFSGNSHLTWEWTFENVAYSFMPIALLLCSVLYVQLKYKNVLWSLVALVILASISLYYAAFFHMFPSKSGIFAMIHILMAVFGVGWALFQAARHNGSNF